MRRIEAIDDISPAAVVLTKDPETGDEVWLISRQATGEQVARECVEVLRIMDDKCARLRTRGDRRGLWLALAALVAFVAPSPLHVLYHGHETLTVAAATLGAIVTLALTALAVREHLGMRRLCRECRD